VLTRRKIRSVGNFRVGVARAPVGQWLNWDRIMWTCAWDVNPLSVFFAYASEVLNSHLGGSVPNGG